MLKNYEPDGSFNPASGLSVNLPLGPSVNWALVLGYVSRDFLNGRKMNFMNETKAVNGLPSLDRLSFASQVSGPIVHARLSEKQPSNVKPMTQLSAN